MLRFKSICRKPLGRLARKHGRLSLETHLPRISCWIHLNYKKRFAVIKWFGEIPESMKMEFAIIDDFVGILDPVWS